MTAKPVEANCARNRAVEGGRRCRPVSPFPTALCAGHDCADGGDDGKHLSKASSAPGRPHVK